MLSTHQTSECSCKNNKNNKEIKKRRTFTTSKTLSIYIFFKRHYIGNSLSDRDKDILSKH